ncbi:MAG: ABC transporter ATP-binding protein, partial [Phycisphaerales bacterium]
ENISDKMSRVIQDTQEIYRGYVALFGKILREPLKAVGVFAVALWVDWRLTLAVVIGAPIGAWILIEFGRRIRKATLKMLQGLGQVLGSLAATLGGMRVVRAYGREGYERRRMWRIERRMYRQHKKIGRIDAMTGPVLETLAMILGMGGIFWLAHQTIGGKMRPEAFFQMAVCLGAMFDPIRKISAVFTRLQKADAAAARIFELIDMPAEQPGGIDRPSPASFSECLEFRGVTFRYPGAERPALCDINLTIRKGQRVAVVGPNGSGKTTLVGLLLRFFEPDEGRILIDGQDIRDVRLRGLRDQFSLVTQDAIVFATTIKENIGYGHRDATEQQILDAAGRAYADEFIRRLPQGYDTLVGESGATLSGGERQRLCLARAILRDAPIFIFDEATSQVDVDSERKIREAMTEFMSGRTSLVIAHRIVTIANADQIIVLDRGRIIDAGDHESLLARCDLYRTLFYSHLHGQMETTGVPEQAAGQRV